MGYFYISGRGEHLAKTKITSVAISITFYNKNPINFSHKIPKVFHFFLKHRAIVSQLFFFLPTTTRKKFVTTTTISYTTWTETEALWKIISRSAALTVSDFFFNGAQLGILYKWERNQKKKNRKKSPIRVLSWFFLRQMKMLFCCCYFHRTNKKNIAKIWMTFFLNSQTTIFA